MLFKLFEVFVTAALFVCEMLEELLVFYWFNRSLIFELFYVWLVFNWCEAVLPPCVDILMWAFSSRF